MTDSLCVIVPVRNAEASLADQVERLLEALPDFSSRFEIVIVDDGSTDHTVEIALDLTRRFPQVRAYEHPQPRGLNAAIATGRRWACATAVVVQEDPASLTAAELRRACPPRAMRRHDQPQPFFDPQLLKRLTRWGEALLQVAGEHRNDSARQRATGGQRASTAECTTVPTGRP